MSVLQWDDASNDQAECYADDGVVLDDEEPFNLASELAIAGAPSKQVLAVWIYIGDGLNLAE